MWLLRESATVEWRLLKNWEAYVRKRKGDEQVEKQMDVKKEKRGHIRALVLKVFTNPLKSLRQNYAWVKVIQSAR